MNTQGTTTLVIGGTGKTGRRVAQRLEALGRQVRIGSRSVEPPFDWTDESTWAPALDGIDAVYLTYFPDIAMPGAPEAIEAFTKIAATTAVQHIVLLSGRGEPEAQRSEAVLQASGIDWTILRSSGFAQNFSEFFLLEPVRTGVVAFPAGDNAEPFIDVDDIADAAVAALTEPGHIGQLYEMTGPRLLTWTDAVNEIANATGRAVQYIPVTPDEYAADAAKDGGLPADDADFLAHLLATIFDGHNASLTDGVQQALGRAPKDFRDFARDAAATGVWDS